MAKTGRKVRTPEERAAFAEQRRAQVAALRDRLAEWQDEASDEMIAAITAMHDGYSERNAMLIAMQRPDATDVEGFRAWLERGRCVRKGEKGIQILAPAGTYTEGGDAPAGQADAPAGNGEAGKTRQFFRIAYVFDIAQTDEVAAKADAA